jgi:hypothetical protein
MSDHTWKPSKEEIIVIVLVLVGAGVISVVVWLVVHFWFKWKKRKHERWDAKMREKYGDEWDNMGVHRENEEEKKIPPIIDDCDDSDDLEENDKKNDDIQVLVDPPSYEEACSPD